MSILGRVARQLQRLDDDRDAALAPIFGFIMLFFAWGMMAILNTGQVAYDKVRLQNTADAVALVQADEAARDLNVMSMNNMALTQMLVVSAVSLTVVETLAEIELRALAADAKIVQEAFDKCPKLTAWPAVVACFAVYAIPAVEVGRVQLQALRVYRRYRPDRGLDTSQRVIGALNRMNDHLVRSFPRRSGETIRLLLDENRADAAFIYPPCMTGGDGDCEGRIGEGGDLPVKRDTLSAVFAYNELCAGAAEGSDGLSRRDFGRHGYPGGKGPYTAGGSQARPHVRDHVNHEAQFADMLPSLDDIMRTWDALIRFSTPPKFSSRQSEGDNVFIDHMNQNWSIVCSPVGGGLLSVASGTVAALPRPYWLKGRPLYAGLSATAGLLAFDRNTLQFLAVVAQQRGTRVNPEDFGERDDAYQAYAQAEVYNTEAYDLFTAQWRTRLVPASFMDQPARVVDALGTREGTGLFDVFAETVQSARESSEWALVNTH